MLFRREVNSDFVLKVQRNLRLPSGQFSFWYRRRPINAHAKRQGMLVLAREWD